MYREGHKDNDIVSAIQGVVGVTVDGNWGPNTTAGIKRYQKIYGLTPDGIVGRLTLETMGLLDTDVKEQYYTTKNGLVIHRHFLPNGEYIIGPIENEYAFLHHTAGWDNPYKVIDAWGRDSRGRIATEFVLGGQKITDNSDNYDGVMVQAFPDGCQGWHLGPTGSYYMNTHSVALEVCSFGWLKNGKTYVGTPACADQISKLDEPFRGHSEYHKYSDNQLRATRKWIEFVSVRDGIDLNQGLITWVREKGAKAFDFNTDAYNGKVKGLLAHTNVNKQKSDCFPQAELIDMLLTF